MFETIHVIGSAIAIEPTIALQDVEQSPRSLDELLVIIGKEPTQYSAMLHTVARKFVEFTGKQPSEIPISDIATQKRAFAVHLRDGKYKAASIKSYRNYLNMLVRRAEAAGWDHAEEALRPEWEAISGMLSKRAARDLVAYASGLGRMPEDVNEDDLANWRKARISEGMQASYAARCCTTLRTAITKTVGRSKLKRGPSRYAIAWEDMHPALRSEVEQIAAWKTSEFQPDRPSSARIRPVTANQLVVTLGQLTGYGQTIAGQPPYESIACLVTRQLVSKYATWAINVRKIKGKPLASKLGMVFAALRHNPAYANLDLAWFDGLLNSLPLEEQSRVDSRKARKIIRYAEAEQIPMQIRTSRTRAKMMTAKKRAMSVRDECLMLWPLILPWRQRNICECRIGGDNPNLFKSTVAPFSSITRPIWISELEKSSPDATFWQFRFEAGETKTGNEIHAFLPQELVVLLEEYLSVHRGILLNGRKDDGTLFLSDVGKAITPGQMTSRVRGLALKYTGVGVTPHLYRDIVAFEWLRCHPKDYLTLSKILWHRNINTTLKIYGSQFNESTGVAMMDDWRASRAEPNR
jgi:integrase